MPCEIHAIDNVQMESIKRLKTRNRALDDSAEPV